MDIINAKIFTMNDKDTIIENGYIKIKDGKIFEVGDMLSYAQSGDELIDADGASAYPGFIDGHTHLGMFEDGLCFEGDDGNESTDPITPQLRAIDAINPFDRGFEEALEGGITTVLTGPGSANPIAGEFAAIKTYGKRIDKMIVSAPAAMKFALGENPKSVYNDKSQMPVTRMATAALIRETLYKSKEKADGIMPAFLNTGSTSPAVSYLTDKGFVLFILFDQISGTGFDTSAASCTFTFLNPNAHLSPAPFSAVFKPVFSFVIKSRYKILISPFSIREFTYFIHSSLCCG